MLSRWVPEWYMAGVVSSLSGYPPPFHCPGTGPPLTCPGAVLQPGCRTVWRESGFLSGVRRSQFCTELLRVASRAG